MNQKLGVEINIPDPLKRNIGRRLAPQIRSGYNRKPFGRSSYGKRRQGYNRDTPARDQYKRKKTGRITRVRRNSRKW